MFKDIFIKVVLGCLTLNNRLTFKLSSSKIRNKETNDNKC